MSERHQDPGDVVHVRGPGWPPRPYLDPPAGTSDHGCTRGWLAVEPDDARPIPCPTCKPWLTEPPATDDQHDDHQEDTP